MTGALINTATVLVGGAAGLALQTRLPEQFQRIALRVLGVVTFAIGVSMLIKTHRVLVLVTALAAGVITGTWLRLQHHLERAAQWVLERCSQPGQSSRIAEGFVTTSLLFCVGPMTVIGSIRDGLTGDFHLIAVICRPSCTRRCWRTGCDDRPAERRAPGPREVAAIGRAPR